MIDLKLEYKTRCGLEVFNLKRLTGNGVTEEDRIQGVVMGYDGFAYTQTWHENGARYATIESNNDLIQVPQK